MAVGHFSVTHHAVILFKPPHAYFHFFRFPYIVLIGKKNIVAVGMSQCVLKILCR